MGAVGTRIDLCHHIENGPIDIDDEGPPFGIRPALVDHAVCRRHPLVRVAQHGIVEVERLGETRVGRGRVTAGGKKCDVELVDARPG